MKINEENFKKMGQQNKLLGFCLRHCTKSLPVTEISSFDKNTVLLDSVLSISGLQDKVNQDPSFLKRNIEKEFDESGVSFSGGERKKLGWQEHSIKMLKFWCWMSLLQV